MNVVGAMNLQVLDIADLKRFGVLSNPRGSYELDIGMIVHARRDHDQLFISVPQVQDDIASDFPISDTRFWHETVVKLRLRQLRFGQRYYFECPITHNDCLKLALSGRLVCSIPAWKEVRNGRTRLVDLDRIETLQRLLKNDGRARLSSVEREKLVAKVLRHPDWFQGDAAVQKIIAREARRKERSRRKFEWESRALSTSKALAEGRGLAQHPLFREVSSFDDDDVRALPETEFDRPLYGGWTHEYAELNIKVLLERFDLKRSDLRGVKLGWPIERTSGREVHMFADCRFSDLPRLVFAFIDAGTGDRLWQKVDLLPGPNAPKARYFLCPVTRARTETLYLRNGVFASHQAQRLRDDKVWSLLPRGEG